MLRFACFVLALCGASASLHVFSSVDGRAVACEVGGVVRLTGEDRRIRVPASCVPDGTVSVHLARGPIRKTPSLDSPAMWGHSEWMKNDIGAVWTRARRWVQAGDHVFIYE